MAENTFPYKLFRVKLASGRVSTVSLGPALLKQAEPMLGGPSQLNTWIRRTALAYEPGPDRTLSRFVSSELQAALGSDTPRASKAKARQTSDRPPACLLYTSPSPRD